MSILYKSKVNIGGKEKVLVVVNYKDDKKKEEKSMDSIHHIQVIDRSGSMSCSISNLIENVKQTISHMSEKDFVSIIWFSGAGQHKVLIKGGKKDDSLYAILDTIKSTVGCTCFSESLKEVGEVINDLTSICPNFNITLFTDGETVTPWSADEERRKIFDEINKWKDKVIAINTVGYGNYYNQVLLQDIAGASSFGQLIHSKNINEYFDIFHRNYERVMDLVIDTVEVATRNNAEILYLNNKSSKLEKGEMKIAHLDKNKNQFILIADSEDIFSVNGETFDSKSITKAVSKDTLKTAIYAYAYSKYYEGDRQLSIDILAKNLGDRALIDGQMNAFTFDEVSEYTEKLRSAVFSVKSRLLGGTCDEDYIPAPDALCVMDILTVLVTGDNDYVYSQNYNRVTAEVTDSYDLFKRNKDEIVTAMDELVFSKEKLNISIRSVLRGTVTLNPIRAEKVGLAKSLECITFRNQTLIKDGSLNMDKITVLVDDFSFDVLMTLNDRYGFIEWDESVSPKTPKKRLMIDLSKLPVVNRNYATQGNAKVILENALSITELEASQKVLSYYAKQSKTYDTYTAEQLEVLKEHGLDASLNYVGVKREVVKKEEEDYYLARELSFTIKGAAALPSVNDVLKRMEAGKVLKGAAQMMAKQINFLNALDMTENSDFLKLELTNVKRNLQRLRTEMSALKIAKVLTGDWFEGLESDGKGNYVYTEGEDTLIVATSREKVYC